MNPSTFQRAAELYLQCRQLPSHARASFLEEQCNGNDDVRGQVLRLLEADGQAEPFVELATDIPKLTRQLHTAHEPSGTRIGSYELTGVIGEGGFGTVYSARQTSPLVRTVALKIIKSGLAGANALARFDAERQALAMMDHPFIARVFDAGATPAGTPYFVMELVSGEPITRFCEGNDLELRERLDLFMQICQGIQHAHTKGVIHRDIKPSNVLVTRIDGRAVPKIIDFGIAKAIEAPLTEREMLTEQRQLLGTPQYMSPEQASAGEIDVDARSDIYSLGVLLYELLTGTTPLETDKVRSAGSFAQIQKLLREQDPPAPSARLCVSEVGASQAKRARCVRGDLDWIVMKALEKDPSRRYPTASELAADVQRHLSGDAVLAGPPSAVYRMKKLVRRHRAAFAVAGVGAGALLLVMAALVWGLLALRQERDRTAGQKRLAEMSAEAARREAARADVVNQFLADMLASVNPNSMASGDPTRGRDVRVAELLDAAAKQLASAALAGDPTARAALQATLGHSYMSLGLYEPAEPMLRAALDSASDIYGPEHPTTIHRRHLLANLLRLRGRLADAEQMQREVLDSSRRAFAPDSPHLAEAMQGLAVTLWTQHRHADAETLLRDALAINCAAYGERHPAVATNMLNLAAQLGALDRPDEAGPLLREAMEIWSEQGGETHPMVATAASNLANLLQKQGKLAAAEEFHRLALRVRTASAGERDPVLANSLNNLATVLEQTDRRDEALQMYRNALAIEDAAITGDHPDTATTLLNLARLLRREGRAPEAEPYARRALQMHRSLFGDEDLQTAQALAVLGLVRQNQRDIDEASSLMIERIDVLRSVHGQRSPEVATAAKDLAVMLQIHGRAAQAEGLAREALAIRRQLDTDDLTETGHALATLVPVLLDLEKFEEAESCARESLKIRSRGAPDPKWWGIADTKSMLGGALVGLGRFDEAEPLLLEGCDGLLDSPDAWPARKRQALARIVTLYEKWSKPEHAAKWRAKLESEK